MKPGSNTLSMLEAPRGDAAGRPCLYLALEAGRPGAGGVRFPLAGLDELRVGRGDARAFTRAEEGDLTVLRVEVPDGRLSSRHFQIANLGGRRVVQDLGSKNGTVVGGARITNVPLADGDVVQAGGTFFVYRAAALPAEAPAAPCAIERGPDGLTTLVPAYARELEGFEAIATSQVPVMLQGETGTGKELAARALHRLSGREGAFVAVNCGALPATLVESELFGYRKGAFSGALEDRPGLVRSADRGTLFLDEIGDLPLTSQAALLRVLQEGEVLPVGATAPLPVDLRVVCATHRNLAGMVTAGTFRADLLARLAGFTLALPPLRERREDLGLLVASLLSRLAPGRSVELTPAAARALLEHDWPGNVRQLERALARALALTAGVPLDVSHLDLPAPGAPAPAPEELGAEERALREKLVQSLAQHEGNVAAVARDLRKDRKQIHRWIDRLGIPRKR